MSQSDRKASNEQFLNMFIDRVEVLNMGKDIPSSEESVGITACV